MKNHKVSIKIFYFLILVGCCVYQNPQDGQLTLLENQWCSVTLRNVDKLSYFHQVRKSYLIWDCLWPLRFFTSEEKKAQGARKENDVLIQRRKEDGSTVPYRVMDTINKLTPQDWQVDPNQLNTLWRFCLTVLCSGSFRLTVWCILVVTVVRFTLFCNINVHPTLKSCVLPCWT